MLATRPCRWQRQAIAAKNSIEIEVFARDRCKRQPMNKMNLQPLLIGACAALACSAARAQGPSQFAAADARLKACIARDSSNDGIQTCTSVVQKIADARLNAVYGSWTDALKHPGPNDAKDDAEILKRLVTAERAWIDLRDKDCALQSTSAFGGTAETTVFSDCRYTLTKARVSALEAARAARLPADLT